MAGATPTTSPFSTFSGVALYFPLNSPVPKPSKNFRPHKIEPSVKLSQRFVVRSHFSHFQPRGGIFLPLSSCSKFSAYALTFRTSPSHVPASASFLSRSVADSAEIIP
uniref:CSON014522 protein n=1 Tax=Culicoides sonorensis TaxID=179676 RepID=A0A336MBW0_CULSO